jgi:hypothetical protein
MASAGDEAKSQAEDTIERIRVLNEEILEARGEWGQGFLDAYEQSMRTFADFEARAAEGTDIEWISKIARAREERYSASAIPAAAIAANCSSTELASTIRSRSSPARSRTWSSSNASGSKPRLLNMPINAS